MTIGRGGLPRQGGRKNGNFSAFIGCEGSKPAEGTLSSSAWLSAGQGLVEVAGLDPKVAKVGTLFADKSIIG